MKIPLIAIVGRPNVGKSTLFNRIIGRRKAIVNDTAGVTRDRLYGDAGWCGHSLKLIDTGGVVPGEDRSIQDFIKRQTVAAMDEADAVVCVFDGREGPHQLDQYLVELIRKKGKKVYYAINKIGDSPKKGSKSADEEVMAPFYELGLSGSAVKLYPISAEHGVGVDELLDDIVTGFTKDDGRNTTDEGGGTNDRRPTTNDSLRVAVIGRPNAGKSTLINRIAGEERVIAHEMAGTTRDCIDIEIERAGKKYVFVDTAGLKKKAKTIETLDKYSTIKTLEAIRRADIVVLTVDANEGFTHQDSSLLDHAFEEGKAVVVAFNKWDALKTKEKELKDFYEEKLFKLRRPPFLYISARNGTGIGELFDNIDRLNDGMNFKMTTSELNRVVEELKDAQSIPAHKGRAVKFYYGTQVKTRPPVFMIFANHPDGVTTAYRRYMINRLQDIIGLGVPVQLKFKKK